MDSGNSIQGEVAQKPPSYEHQKENTGPEKATDVFNPSDVLIPDLHGYSAFEMSLNCSTMVSTVTCLLNRCGIVLFCGQMILEIHITGQPMMTEIISYRFAKHCSAM